MQNRQLRSSYPDKLRTSKPEMLTVSIVSSSGWTLPASGCSSSSAAAAGSSSGNFRTFAVESQLAGLIAQIDTDAKDSPGVFGVPTLHYSGTCSGEY